MRIEAHLSETQGYRLNRAILLYENENKAVATLHGIHAEAKTSIPRLSMGVPLDKTEFAKVARQIAGAKDATVKHQLLPPNLLLADEAMLMWWLPSQKRRIHFATGNKPFDAAVNGREVLHPGLLFQAAQGGLSVWALDKNERPQSSTRLWRAPYMNIYDTGHLCQGTFRFPDDYRIEGIEQWERGFFETHFSHTNIDARLLTKHPNGHNALWQEMSKTRLKNFPASYLVPLPIAPKSKTQMTLGQVIGT